MIGILILIFHILLKFFKFLENRNRLLIIIITIIIISCIFIRICIIISNIINELDHITFEELKNIFYRKIKLLFELWPCKSYDIQNINH
jgi:phosphotransferase system  glucose/maltose/N-acetylglucosamine-specific IIC component